MAERKRIASAGGKARATSFLMAKRVIENLRYAAAVSELRGDPVAVARLNAFNGPLPGVTSTGRQMNDMAAPDDTLDDAADIASRLTDLGLTPVLVGGMALVMIGSRRVTRDFDFVISQPGRVLSELVDRLYDQGLELASRLNDNGDVISTISNRRVAAARLRIDAPASAYFLNPKTGLRIDLLFDFPIPAATLAEHATRAKIRSHVFTIASEADLLRLKQIAKDQRSLATDTVDIAFLEARRQNST